MKLNFRKTFKVSISFLSTSLLTLTFLLSGCSNDMSDLTILDNNATKKDGSIQLHVSKNDAIGIANKVLRKNSTRSGSLNMPTIEYVVDNNSTRNTFIADTLAYILNYPNDKGFVIVSTDRRVYPVLGFSYEGNFSLENEIAKNHFIENIGSYIQSAPTDTLYTVSDNDFDACYSVEPMIQISLSQGSPWNKYVIQEHPGCPAGCVAVATALVMSHAKYNITYHDTTFNFKSIITAISDIPEPILPINPEINADINPIGDYQNPIQPPITYQTAVNSMAKLIYWIGKDIDMIYAPDGSAASSYRAYNLCKSLNYSIPSGYATFDIKQITQYLNDNHIVYIRGDETSGKGGHAWVSDACYFCVDLNDPTQILDTYIHCDWGWGGLCNGYYSGAVFEAKPYNFKPSNYFAVKRLWK